MYISQTAEKTADACRFCWMCRHICPVGNATGRERNTARARGLSLSMVKRGAIEFDQGVVENLYECALCGACTKECATGFDPMTYTREGRLAAALEGKTPDYIMKLAENLMQFGSAYGERKQDAALAEVIAGHKEGKTLLYLGMDARESLPEKALEAIRLLEGAGVEFALLPDEPMSGYELYFLIGGAEETFRAFEGCAEALKNYDRVIALAPSDARIFRREYAERGIALPPVVTLTSFLASLVEEGKLTPVYGGKKLTLQDDFNLGRELEETEPARLIVAAAGEPVEMLCHKKDAHFAGSLLMRAYMPDVVDKIARNRAANAAAVGVGEIVCESLAEYGALKAAGAEVKMIWNLF